MLRKLDIESENDMFSCIDHSSLGRVGPFVILLDGKLVALVSSVFQELP